MQRKVLALIVAFLVCLPLASCSKEEVSSEISEENIDSLGTAINVTKMDSSEEWVIIDESDENFPVPQLNVSGLEAGQINTEIAGFIAKNKSEYRKAECSFGVKDALVSILIKLEDYEGKEHHSAYNFSLSNAKRPSSEQVMDYYGLKPIQFRALCADAMSVEYSIKFDYYIESNPADYDKGLEATRDIENLKKCVPFVHSSGKLYFVGKMALLNGEEMEYCGEAKQRSLITSDAVQKKQEKN